METGCYAIPGASGTRRIQRRRRDSDSLVQFLSSPHSTPYTLVQNRSLFFLVETGCYAIPGASGTRRIQRRRRDSGSLVQISSSPHSTHSTLVQNRNPLSYPPATPVLLFNFYRALTLLPILLFLFTLEFPSRTKKAQLMGDTSAELSGAIKENIKI